MPSIDTPAQAGLAQYTESRPTKLCHVARSAKRRPAVGDSRHCRRTSQDCARLPKPHSTPRLATLRLPESYSLENFLSLRCFARGVSCRQSLQARSKEPSHPWFSKDGLGFIRTCLLACLLACLRSVWGTSGTRTPALALRCGSCLEPA